ncbi:hypothetical protein ACFY5F_36135 [Streptomyces sp. NPDC013161]|uniref:hypothetical protein n=1 Tax=Streptomyces sp. NPDC013161 TaxID=3364862 RepID=UPI00368B75A5
MDTAVVGLIGTVVGAVSGVIGTRTTTRLGGTEQRHSQNDQSARQERTTAYAKLVSACSGTYRLGYAVHVAVQDTRGRAAPSPGVAERLQEFNDAVESALEVVSLVKLHGSEEIARAADNLASAMSGWYREVAFLAQGEGDAQWAGEAIELFEELEERFIFLGRKALSSTPVLT